MATTNMTRQSGCSVTQRIKQVKQPRGGYIKPKESKTRAARRWRECAES